ncbi:hypothetical protein EI94DRAFT_1699553 [Lactarius quietus]|nr:hypothetical protein EI94DRAFT_1699553 [Lactarius quietus]
MSLLALEEQEFPLSTSSILQSSIFPSDSALQVDQYNHSNGCTRRDCQSFEKAKAQQTKKESLSESRRMTDKCTSTSFSNAGADVFPGEKKWREKGDGCEGLFWPHFGSRAWLLPHSYSSPIITMSLQINWNTLYSTQLKKWEEVEERILDYCIREGLYEQGVTIADVTYVLHSI